jgi:hypothetical protein
MRQHGTKHLADTLSDLAGIAPASGHDAHRA